MKKRNSLFLAGMLTGIIGTSAVFLAVQFKAEKNVPERPAVAPAPYAAEFFPPLYTRTQCRKWIRYVEHLMKKGYNHTNWDMAMAAGLESFLRMTELHLLANERARSLAGAKQDAFVAKHKKWVELWEKQSREPPRDPDGNLIEGTMAIPIQAGHPGYLIEQYIKKSPEWTEFVHSSENENSNQKKGAVK